MIANPNIANQNIGFQRFIDFVNANQGASGKSLVKLHGGERAIDMKPAADDKISSWFRNDNQKLINNIVRDAFLKSVLDRFHASNASQLPESIKDAMCLKDYRGFFGVQSDMTGVSSTNTGKPLSLRRIRTVVQTVQSYEATRDAFNNSPVDFNLREFNGPGRDFVNKEYKHFKSCLKGFNYKGHAQDVFANMFTRMASYPEEVKRRASKDPMGLFDARRGVSNLHVPALRTCLNSNPEFRDYINNDQNGAKRHALELYANSGNGVSHQIAKDLLEMLRVHDSIKLTDDIRKLKTDNARYTMMDRMRAKDLVAFFKTAFAYPTKLPLTRQLAADYVKNQLGPMLMQKGGGFFMRNYVGNYFLSPDGDSSKDVSWAKVVLRTLKETVLPNMKPEETDGFDVNEYKARIEELLPMV